MSLELRLAISRKSAKIIEKIKSKSNPKIWIYPNFSPTLHDV